MKIGFLTSGGDCQALNAAMRGTAKYLYEKERNKVEFYGFLDGYKGLIRGNYKKMKIDDFEDILNLGGSIIGNSRTPFKLINEPDEEGRDKVKSMIDTYKKTGLDCLVVAGGNGSHKTANLLFEKGLNVVTLPKTIDNDLEGIDVSFGFQSAIDVATDYIDKLQSTAKSHGRVFVVEVMGHKTGWLTLHAGIASNSDIILIPEIPYDINAVVKDIEEKEKRGKKYIIIAAAEGIISKEESLLTKKELKKKRKEGGNLIAAERLARELEPYVDKEIRTASIGHIQRGGNPCAYDRVLATRLGVMAGELIENKKYGYMATFVDNKISSVPLSDVAGKTKMVNIDNQLVLQAKKLGICLGE